MQSHQKSRPTTSAHDLFPLHSIIFPRPVDATPVVPDYEDGDFDSYARLSSKPKKAPEPTWLLLPHRGKNLSCGVLGFTHFRAVARRPGMADSDVAHLYLHVIRCVIIVCVNIEMI